jgi:hypothetical protein
MPPSPHMKRSVTIRCFHVKKSLFTWRDEEEVISSESWSEWTNQMSRGSDGKRKCQLQGFVIWEIRTGSAISNCSMCSSFRSSSFLFHSKRDLRMGRIQPDKLSDQRLKVSHWAEFSSIRKCRRDVKIRRDLLHDCTVISCVWIEPNLSAAQSAFCRTICRKCQLSQSESISWISTVAVISIDGSVDPVL